MKIKLEKITINEETFVPSLLMKVLLDAEQMIKIIDENGRDEASTIIGEMFLNEFGDILDEISNET